MGLLKGLNGAPRTSMGSLEGPQERQKVKQYLARDLRGMKWGPTWLPGDPEKVP
jgi:hypothetical protein